MRRRHAAQTQSPANQEQSYPEIPNMLIDYSSTDHMHCIVRIWFLTEGGYIKGILPLVAKVLQVRQPAHTSIRFIKAQTAGSTPAIG